MNKLKKIKNQLILSVVIAILGILAIVLLVSVFTAKSTGTKIGTDAGTLVGKVTGSVKAVTNASDYFNEGKQQGVEANDIKINEIEQSIKAKKEFSVLEANITMDDIIEIGEGEKNKYKALLIYNGKIDFKVDFAQAKIEYDKATDILYVTLPKPNAVLTLESPKVLDEKKKITINDADLGSIAYVNSQEKIKSSVETELKNYDSLIELAKIETKIQAKKLIGSLSFAKDVVIKIEGSEQ